MIIIKRSYHLGPPKIITSLTNVTIIIPTEIILGNSPFSFVIQVKYAIIGEQKEKHNQPLIKFQP